MADSLDMKRMNESKQDDNDNDVMPQQDGAITKTRCLESSGKPDHISTLENKESNDVNNEQKVAKEELQGRNTQNEECDNGIDKNQEASGGINVAEEGKLQFWRTFVVNPVDKEISRYLIDHGADVYFEYKDGGTVLWIGTRNGLVDLVKYFVQYGPDQNFHADCVALKSAIQSRSLEIVKYFVEDCGADINIKDESGKTALHHAVDDGVTDIVRYLVEKCGADVNGKDTGGWTVLHAAISKGTLGIAEYLVEKGADINATNDSGWTALHSAVTKGTLEIVKYLVENGADVNGKDIDGWTYLVEKGADVNGKNTNGWTVLHSAVTEGALEMVKYLVEKGAKVNGEDTDGWTVLHSAVTESTLEMIIYLSENGANVNGKDIEGMTVLHGAVSKGTLEMVKYLIDMGAGVNDKHSDGWTVLHAAVSKGTLEMVKLLLEMGANVNSKDNEGWTVLHYAVSYGRLEVVKYFIEMGTNVNSKKTNGRTVLHAAVIKGTLPIVKHLVESGADVNGEDADGWTVLHSAVTEGTLEIVKYLVEKGANVNGKKSNGKTVLHSAVTKGTMEIVRYLVEHGADVNGKDADGWSVLHIAVDTGTFEIVQYLVEQGSDVTLESKRDFHSLDIDILEMAIVNNSVVLVNFLLEKDIAVWRIGTFLVEGRQMSLIDWCIYIGHDEIAVILKSSIKHREKIKMLKTFNCNQLEKIGVPMQDFVAKNQFKIGDGCCGSCVYVGLMKDGSEVAVKRILVQSDDNTVENEKEIMSLIKTDNSPFIVSYRHFHRGDDFMYLIVDLCEENLRELVHASSIEYLQEHGPRMIKEVLFGLEFLHGKGILHRDLKPSNVLVDIEGRMKLADFGISRILNDDETTVETYAKGTPGWMPPEVIKAIEKNEKGPFKRKSDVQVAGMIAFFVLTKGEHPFGSSFDRMRNILEGNCVSIDRLDDREARHFVSWLISHKIDDRPYAHEALRDSFINGD
ncbi:uncharacterized protein LOC114519384 [Dendronephthya gigantea]|uniref:uncharacterized protein LOC114519384 n=1 Tax=Dendronephthya gigantea TaxID=151771 RepID=UPI00106BD038|nr:uncharacterized protein LOC114519384 [Dendronephthya gigantea]